MPISTMSNAGLNTYLHTDHNGTATTSTTVTASGFTTPIRRNQDPYGNPLGTPTGTWRDRTGFIGKHQDPRTALTELGARQYDPTTGRFTQVDPVLDPLDPVQNNGYNYGWNNPVTNSDPDGLEPINKACFGQTHTDMCRRVSYGGSYGQKMLPADPAKAVDTLDRYWIYGRSGGYDVQQMAGVGQKVVNPGKPCSEGGPLCAVAGFVADVSGLSDIDRCLNGGGALACLEAASGLS